MRRHAAQYGGIGVAHEHVHGGFRGHAERLGDVKDLFRIVTALRIEALHELPSVEMHLTLPSLFCLAVL